MTSCGSTGSANRGDLAVASPVVSQLPTVEPSPYGSRAAAASEVPGSSDANAHSQAAESAVSGHDLVEDLKQTLQAGPAKFMLVKTGGFPDPVLLDGVEDLGHGAAEFVLDEGGAESAKLTVGGATYFCAPAADVVISFKPGYCDATSPWFNSSSDGSAVVTLTRTLPAMPKTVPADTRFPVRALGVAQIHGVSTAGYSIDIDDLPPATEGTKPGKARLVFWVDVNHLVRDFEITVWLDFPMYTAIPDQTDPSDESVPDPSLQADRRQLELQVPGGLPSPSTPPPGTLMSTTAVQFWDFGNTPAISAPPRAAVSSVNDG